MKNKEVSKENNKIDENDTTVEAEEEMVRKKVKQMPRKQQKAVMSKIKITTKKRIYNPKTKTFYRIRQKTTQRGQKGQIKGVWKPPRTIKSYHISGNIKKSDIDKALRELFRKKKR